MKWQLASMNMELTTACPLRCPQCYCNLDNGRHLNIDIAKRRADDAAKMGIKTINLSGGETMCYPDLYDLIAYSALKVEEVSCSFSGVFFSQEVFERLVSAGITNIHISLNGSTREINNLSRDGFDYAIEALSLLRENHFPRTVINWVMHSNNAYDFERMIHLAEDYEAASLVILSFKPDSHNALASYPTKEQIVHVVDIVKHYKGKVNIQIESCFSNMLALYLDTKLFGNLNISKYKGCGAGRFIVNVNVDGAYTPCRHIDCPEGYESLEEYWEKSGMLRELRNLESHREEPCLRCRYMNYCRHCQAINWQMKNSLHIGFAGCPLYQADLEQNASV